MVSDYSSTVSFDIHMTLVLVELCFVLAKKLHCQYQYWYLMSKETCEVSDGELF